MSERIDLAQAGIEVTTAAHLASPSLLGEYVAGLTSGYQALFLDGLARGMDARGPRGYRNHILSWLDASVRGLGDARSKAIRKLVADLNRGISDAP